MSPDRDNGPDDDAGEAIDLSALEVRPSPGFFGRLRSKLERRSLTGNVLSFSWYLPGMLLLQALEIIFDFFSSKPDRKGGAP